MKHLKTIMIIAVLLMILGFCVCMLFGMWCMYDEGIRENQRQEVRVEEMEIYGREPMTNGVLFVNNMNDKQGEE